jgi:electron transfer flavoprotein beta subunit
MDILVCISKTPDTTSKIGFIDNNTKFDSDGVSFIMNPYDEWYALVRAIELVEKHGGKVTVISVGGADIDIVIRKALAIGADEAVRVDSEPHNSFFVAKEISNFASENNFDAIFTGKETIDFNGSEVGALISEFLNLPFLSYVSKLDFDGTNTIVERDIEGGIERIEIKSKYVLSAAKGLAEQRIPNMKGIMMAKRKPLNIISPSSNENNKVTIKNFELPIQKQGVKMINPEDMDELVRLLHEEAKVL